MRTGGFAAIFLVFFFTLVAGRDYCYNKNTCQVDANCTQYFNNGQPWGLCCGGMCTKTSTVVYRGDACDSHCTFCGNGLTCTNGVCTASLKNQNCNCTAANQCNSNFCSITTNTCKLLNEGNGYACETAAQCLSLNCSTTSKCQAQQFNGSCSVYNYPGTCVSGYCPNWGSDPRSNICRALSGSGEDCQADTDCKSGLGCFGISATNPNFGSCLADPKLNGPCYNSTQANQPCGYSNYICNNGTCINSLTLPGGAVCDNSQACESQQCNMTTMTCVPLPNITYVPIGQMCNWTQTCANNGYCLGSGGFFITNGTCIAPNSVADGDLCYQTSPVCMTGSLCKLNTTSGAYDCTRVLGATCVFNSTSSDNTQCGNGYICGCDSTCQKTTTTTLPSCSAYQNALYALGYPQSMSPLTMPSNVANAFAAYECCQGCWRNGVMRTWQTGYQISCNSKGYKINAWSNCNLTAHDAMAYTDCDKFNGATTMMMSPVLSLLSLLAAFYLFH